VLGECIGDSALTERRHNLKMAVCRACKVRFALTVNQYRAAFVLIAMG
jgi:hypothetical protein